MAEQKRVLSCIQPTGDIHFGNYFGAVQNWVALQSDYECVFGIVDYHAMTVPYSPKKLRENTWNLAFNLLAMGIEPQNLFVQSLVPEHAELSWILNCFCSYGHLTRMTQFKDKSQNQAEDGFISAGLLDYPVLQAADILIYRADFVPVGKDQDQHLELSRAIAQRFNNQVGKEYFVTPKTLHTATPKIRSTADPTRKMSKSAGEKHAIGVFSEEAKIRKMIRSAVTDTGESTGDISAGVANLLELLRAAGKQSQYEEMHAAAKAGNMKYAPLKDAVAEALVELSQEFRARRDALNSDKKAVKSQVKAASAEIRKRAQQTLRDVKELCGLLNVPK